MLSETVTIEEYFKDNFFWKEKLIEAILFPIQRLYLDFLLLLG